MKAVVSTIVLFALLGATARANTPKIGCAAEVGNSAGAGRNWVLVFLRFSDGAEPHPAYRVYWKPGPAAAANPYTALATLQPATSPATLAHILARAGQTGVDLAALEVRLDGILDQQNPGGTRANKLSFLIQAAELQPASSQLFHFSLDLLAENNPAVAAARGRAYFANVPASGASTFEVRAYDPSTGLEGQVVGRATVQSVPEVLPAPNFLAEYVDPRPHGHLRVQLRWCYPPPLRHRFLHFGGACVFRADRAHWQSAFGSDPPASLTRAELLSAVSLGHVVQVNGLPHFPEERPTDPGDPAYGLPLFTDDNDRAGAASLATGVPFTAGDQFMYWVCKSDLLGRIGHPSSGTMVTVCDRIAPDPPRGLSASNHRRFAGGTAEDYIRLEWPVAPPEEVRRWYLYCSARHNDLLEAYASDPANPIVPGQLLAVIDNDGSRETPDGQRIHFEHTASVSPDGVGLPLPGETVYYRLRAEDDTPCKVEDRGNISGPSGPVPASLYDYAPSSPVTPWIEVPCCEIDVNHQPQPGEAARPYTAFLRAERPSEGFRWVEFRRRLGPTQHELIGRYEFRPGQDHIEVPYQPGDSIPHIYGARFGHRGGLVSGWSADTPTDPMPFYRRHVFTPEWRCEEIPALPPEPPRLRPEPCPGYLLPFDPPTGNPTEVCIRFSNLAGDLGSWIVYKQVGKSGKKTRIASGNVDPDDPAGVLEICDKEFPPRGGEICWYVQGFSKNGIPGGMELAGCVKVAPRDRLPRPTITAHAPATESDPGASEHEHDLGGFCPPVAERFEIALCPAPVGAAATFFEFTPAGQLCEWGLLEVPGHLAQSDESEFEFASRLLLVNGVGYRCKVRAVAGFDDERDHGPWSDPVALHWLNQPPGQLEVPWPMRDVPDVSPTPTPNLVWDQPARILRVEIGKVPTDQLAVFPTTHLLPADTMEPYLYYDLPIVAYLRDVTPGASGRMLQVTHRHDEILTQTVGSQGIRLIDSSIMVTPGPVEPAGPTSLLWLRIEQPVFLNHTYEVFLVLHNPDGEIREVLRTNEAAVQ